jgi:predicted dehydrogenase
VIVGCGNVARTAHLPGFARAPAPADRLEIVGAVDAVADAAELSRAIGGLPVVRHLDDIAALGPIDFVDICTPSATHVELALRALERGYHVICEKPVAIRTADAERLAEAARRAGRLVMPCHQYRFNPAWRQVKQWLDRDAIGAWSLAEFQVYRLHADRGASTERLPWRATRAGSQGGVLLDHGTHLIYELLDVAGPPASVRAWTTRVRHHEYEVEDTAQLIFDFPDRFAVLFLTWAAHHRETRIRFVGARGTIAWEGGMLELARDGAVERLDFTAQLDKASYRHWFADLFQEFVVALDTGDGQRFLDDIAQVAAVLEAGYGAG